MKIISGLDLAFSALFFSLIGLAYAQCAMCGAERNAAERGQGNNTGGTERGGGNRDRNDPDRDRGGTTTVSRDAPTPSATNERRNEMGYRMIEQMASNPDFGNIEPGNAEGAQALGNHVKETYENWDSEKSVVDNVREAVGIKNETREMLDLPNDVPYHNEDRIVLP